MNELFDPNRTDSPENNAQLAERLATLRADLATRKKESLERAADYYFLVVQELLLHGSPALVHVVDEAMKGATAIWEEEAKPETSTQISRVS